MKLNLHSSLIFAILLSLVGIAIVTSQGTPTRLTTNSAASMNKSPVSMEQQPIDESGVIDGAKNPEKIPDHVAYSLFFRMICCRKDAEEQSQGRAYVRRLGLDETGIDTLIAMAEEFYQRIAVVEIQAAEITTRYHPNHLNPTADEKGHLKQLQKRKEEIIDDIVASFPSRLGDDGSVKVNQFVKENVKRKVKIR